MDFEKYWGIHDVVSWQKKKEELLKVKEVVTKLLSLFEKEDIHASWATVGMLFAKSIEELQKNVSQLDIHYKNPDYSPYRFTADELNNIPFEILNAREEIELILKTAHQELSSHTYSHYYTLEEGQTNDDFGADLTLMSSVAKEYQHQFKTIVFPRNQVNKDYLNFLGQDGYVAYRGNQENNLWASSPYAKESLSKKGKRVIDAYYNLSTSKTYRIDQLEIVKGLVNIPASRFLRPSTGKKLLEKRKIKRIKEEMRHAAQRGEIYHLWWHPHNFSKRTEEHFEQLQHILDHFKQLNDRYGFTSLNMSEIGAIRKK